MWCVKNNACADDGLNQRILPTKAPKDYIETEFLIYLWGHNPRIGRHHSKCKKGGPDLPSLVSRVNKPVMGDDCSHKQN